MGLLEDINFEKNYLIYISLGILLLMFSHIAYLNNQVEGMANVNQGINDDLKGYITQIHKCTNNLKRNKLRVSNPSVGSLRIGNEQNYWEIVPKLDDTYKLSFTSYSTDAYSSDLNTLRDNKGSFALQRYYNSPITRNLISNVIETPNYVKIN